MAKKVNQLPDFVDSISKIRTFLITADDNLRIDRALSYCLDKIGVSRSDIQELSFSEFKDVDKLSLQLNSLSLFSKSSVFYVLDSHKLTGDLAKNFSQVITSFSKGTGPILILSSVGIKKSSIVYKPVSYTHLTLPTICSV